MVCAVRIAVTSEPDVEYLPSSLVRKRYGNRSRMWLWRMMDQHGFPQPVKLIPGINSINFWKLSDLLAWEAQQQRKTAGHARRKPPVRHKRKVAA